MIDDQKTDTQSEQRWKVLAARSPEADAPFYYGVTTTGVFCRPGCASRLPQRQHVRFFDSPSAAAAAGFRPCKRCRPDLSQPPDDVRAAVLKACELISAASKPPTLDELARAVGLSPHYFQRRFKGITGVTPRQYAQQIRAQRLQSQLGSSGTVTDAVFDAGYSSSSTFYQQSNEALGMKPSTYKNGGDGARIFFTVRDTSLGWILIAATEIGVCAIEFGDSHPELEASLRARFPLAELIAGHSPYEQWVQSILAYLDRPAADLDLPLDIRGTAFQRQVWTALRQIPLGETISYTELARRIGQPSAVRAAAQACASNKIAVAIPCHRVVRSDGSLSGYRWGLERKRKLIERERDS
jgi:AraC family transcriptional regulator, regulatory protein of adaptative response / methylated-DNA-[protein]-cysteine methyltransferase